MSDAVVKVAGLSKTYRLGFWLSRKVPALRGLDLEIGAGQIYGLVGPNGAGKSTTIKILLNLVKQSEGTATLFGKSPADKDARRQVGFVPENPAPYEYLTGSEFLSLSGKLAGLSGQDLDVRMKEALGAVDMTRAASLQIRRYSKGMVQRITLAQAIIAKPKLLILDEPTSGLDPLGRRQIRDLILQQRASGTTVLFCSHIIPDVEFLCDRVAVLVKGKRVHEGPLRELLKGEAARVEIGLEGLPEPKLAELSPKVELLQHVEGRSLIRIDEKSAQEVLQKALGLGARVTRFAQIQFGLEELFLKAMQDAGTTVGSEVSVE
ncbi:MAG: ABC transporter ATP-binding protein [Myxococcaceae bacterium]